LSDFFPVIGGYTLKRRTKDTQTLSRRVVDIKNEIPESQLAAIGAMALAFNEAEAALDRLFFVVTGLTEALQLEISTRIGGLDGKIEIIKKGAVQFLDEPNLRLLQELLGDGAFGRLKDYRDGAIHVRHLNPSTGIGVKVDRKAQVFDYLVSEKVLNIAYNLLVAVQKELDEVVILAQGMKALKLLAAGDPNRAPLEAKITICHFQFQLYHNERLALPQLPEFPSESELRAADFQAQQALTAILTGWYNQSDTPITLRTSGALLDDLSTPVLHHPLDEGE
jgi:hypothetical protein